MKSSWAASFTRKLLALNNSLVQIVGGTLLCLKFKMDRIDITKRKKESKLKRNH